MTRRACEANQKLARTTSSAILGGEETVFTLPEHAVNRMLTCGWCPSSNVSKGRSKKAFRKSINLLIDKIERYDEWGADPERSRINTAIRSKIWRKDHADEIKEKSTSQTREKRIDKLKRRLGDVHDHKEDVGR